MCRDFKAKFLNALSGELNWDDQSFLLGYFSEILLAGDTGNRLACIGDLNLARRFINTNYNRRISYYKVTSADVTQYFSVASR